MRILLYIIGHYGVSRTWIDIAFNFSCVTESGLVGCEAAWLLRTEVSKERIASIVRVTRIGELGTTLAVTITEGSTLRRNTKVLPSELIFFALMMEAVRFSETSILTWAIRLYIPVDGILHSHRRHNIKSYFLTLFYQRLAFDPWWH
jgi:hypothetical protein